MSQNYIFCQTCPLQSQQKVFWKFYFWQKIKIEKSRSSHAKTKSIKKLFRLGSIFWPENFLALISDFFQEKKNVALHKRQMMVM